MRDKTTWMPSPNFRKGRSKKISAVVLHATATPGLDSPLNWLRNPDAKVSAHYLIGRDGATFCLVDEADVAWHAGESEWNGQANVNGFSVGIELVNDNTGKQLYPEAQLAACAELVAAICKDHQLATWDVCRHLDIAPGRKTDPAGFPFDAFKERLAALGVPHQKETA
jgi:N-acetylmuramoyl-L-alanine amidase